MRRVVVEESFNITGRGAAAVFRGTTDGLPLGHLLRVRIQRPDGSALDATATLELSLRTRPRPVERATLLIAGVTREDVPPDSVLLIHGKCPANPG